MDEDVGQDIHEPEKADSRGKTGKAERDDTFYFAFLFSGHDALTREKIVRRFRR